MWQVYATEIHTHLIVIIFITRIHLIMKVSVSEALTD